MTLATRPFAFCSGEYPEGRAKSRIPRGEGPATEEAAIMFATEAKTSIKTAWPQLSANNIILPPYLELSQQQSVPSKDPPHRQQQSHKCGPEERFQQQPMSSDAVRGAPIGTRTVHQRRSRRRGRPFRMQFNPRKLHGKKGEEVTTGIYSGITLTLRWPPSTFVLSTTTCMLTSRSGFAKRTCHIHPTCQRQPTTSRQCIAASSRTWSTSRHSGSSSVGQNRPRPVHFNRS